MLNVSEIRVIILALKLICMAVGLICSNRISDYHWVIESISLMFSQPINISKVLLPFWWAHQFLLTGVLRGEFYMLRSCPTTAIRRWVSIGWVTLRLSGGIVFVITCAEVTLRVGVVDGQQHQEYYQQTHSYGSTYHQPPEGAGGKPTFL